MTIHVFRKLKDTNGIIRSRKSNEKLHNSKKKEKKKGQNTKKLSTKYYRENK